MAERQMLADSNPAAPGLIQGLLIGTAQSVSNSGDQLNLSRMK